MLNFFKNNFGQRRVKRSHMKAKKNLGVIALDIDGDADKRYRDPRLAALDAYYENTQYDGLTEWDQAIDAKNEHIPVRQRKPRLIVPFAKGLTSRLAAKMFGDEVFPSLIIKESPDDQEFVKAVVRESQLKFRILEPMRRLLNTGSVFIRFWIVDGALKMEFFDSKYCYPIFSDGGELESIDVKYVYVDPEEKDQNGDFKKKWFKMTLNTEREILFDNPDYDPNNPNDPEFQVVEEVVHGFGFVQGEWFRTSENKHSPDGFSIIEDLTSFIDELCYSFSQSSQAVGYNQDPQLWFKGMNEDEIENVIRSAAKSWHLGREGEVGFAESTLVGVERAGDLRDKIRTNIQDWSRIVLLDPEKIVGSAQSGKAMEVLHGPMIDLICELRGMIEPVFKKLVLKMSLAILMSAKRGLEVPIEIPPGYQPKDLDFLIKWKPIFQQTIEDLAKKVSLASQAVTSRLISEESGTRFIAEDFNIEDVEAEIAKIKAQPIPNPFGGFS